MIPEEMIEAMGYRVRKSSGQARATQPVDARRFVEGGIRSSLSLGRA